jgi:Flp pilus assembly protein TadD
MRAVRPALVLLALAICAWFALGVRQARSLGRAEAIITTGNHLTAAQFRSATALLNEADALNPDRTVELDRIHLLLGRGRDAEANRLARQAVSAEPQNIEAWIALAESSSTNLSLYRYAVHRVNGLEPLLPAG